MKAIGYVRVPRNVVMDVNDQATQERAIKHWCNENGLWPIKLMVEIADAPGNALGPVLNAALEQLGPDSALVIQCMDRVAPNLKDWLMLTQRVAGSDASLVAIEDGFDTLPASISGQVVHNLFAAMSEMANREKPAPPKRLAGVVKTEQDNAGNDYLSIYHQSGKLVRDREYHVAAELWRVYLETATGEGRACGWNCLGDIHIKLDCPAEAMAAYQQAVTHFDSANLPDRAVSVVEKVRRYHPENATLMLMEGRLNARIGRLGDAVGAYLGYATAMREAADWDGVDHAFDKIRILNPADPEFRLQMAAEMQVLGLADAAVAEMICAAELMIHNEQLNGALEMLVAANRETEHPALESFIHSLEEHLELGDAAPEQTDDASVEQMGLWEEIPWRMNERIGIPKSVADPEQDFLMPGIKHYHEQPWLPV